MIFTLLKNIHLLALVLGAAASLGNIYILLAKGPHDLPAPGFLNALRKWYRWSALVAILTLWVTGVMLAVIGYGWPTGFAFNAKLLFALVLLAIIVFVNFMAPVWARRGGPPSYANALSITGALSFVLAVTFAVWAVS